MVHATACSARFFRTCDMKEETATSSAKVTQVHTFQGQGLTHASPVDVNWRGGGGLEPSWVGSFFSLHGHKSRVHVNRWRYLRSRWTHNGVAVVSAEEGLGSAEVCCMRQD
jgi:hypothetical protein